MRRYEGQSLPPSPRIAVVSGDALGNFLAVTPLLALLRSTYPDAQIEYGAGPLVAELANGHRGIDAFFNVCGDSARELSKTLTTRPAYDWVINVEARPWFAAASAILADENTLVTGPILGPSCRALLPFEETVQGTLWQDDDWTASDLVARHPILESGFICEIFCRLAYLSGPIPRYQVRSEVVHDEIPDVLIATSASLTEKLWPAEKWQALVHAAKGMARLPRWSLHTCAEC